MWFKRPKKKESVQMLSMCDLDLWDMTAEEKEERCQKRHGKSYNEYLRWVFDDYTPEQIEEVRRQWEYPKPE